MTAESNAGPKRVEELVAYQQGAIVSRIVLKRDGGSVTVFAFDAGQSLSEHTVPHSALVHVLDGDAEITVGGTVHRVRAGHVVELPANVPHAVAAPGRFKMVLTMLK
ncbi:MAG: cupin domain-containing protein [Gemmatimonadota bacterium]|nr:cupin domain-containing protein [Gemmatimonadota bacterium]